MSVAQDSFWEVQKIWGKVKDSSLARGKGEAVVENSNNTALPDLNVGERLLRILAERGSFNSYELSQEIGKDHQQVVGAIKSVQSLGDVSVKSVW